MLVTNVNPDVAWSGGDKHYLAAACDGLAAAKQTPFELPIAYAALPPWKEKATITVLCRVLQECMLRCRVRATEAVGVIAASVGMEALGPSLQDFVAAALQVGKALAHTQTIPSDSACYVRYSPDIHTTCTRHCVRPVKA